MTASSPVAASPELLRRDDDNGVVTLTLNTPHNLNALSLAMIETLIATFDALANDDSARAVVLAGAGSALSAGHDLKEMQAHRNDCDRGRSSYVDLFARCSALMQAIVALPKPVIAAAGGRHRGGLPAHRRLRSRGRGGARALRPLGRQFRPVLLDPAGRGRARRSTAQAGDGDGDDGAPLQRRRS